MKARKYVMPALVAAFALMIVSATPYIIAESDKSYKSDDDSKMHKKHKTMDVEEFVGRIQITEDSDKSALKEQITVSLSEAAAGLDVIKGELAKVSNEDGQKFLVWKLVSVEKDPDSDTVTKTIHIVDAADADNTKVITKEFDKADKKSKDVYDKEQKTAKIEKLEKKFSGPTGNEELDSIRAQFVEKVQQLKEAHENGL